MPATKSILVVEDDATARRAMKALLGAAGYSVTCAANGREALEYLRSGEPPFVILLDLSMPVMSGWEFRERQQQTPTLAPIPVVILSAEVELPRIAKILGAANYCPKPVEFEGLLETIRLLGNE